MIDDDFAFFPDDLPKHNGRRCHRDVKGGEANDLLKFLLYLYCTTLSSFPPISC